MYRVVNPASGETLSEYPVLCDDELQHEIEAAAAAFPDWAARTIADRAALTRRVADVFEERIDDFLPIMAREMGKRPAEGRGEIETVVSIFRYYADRADELLADEQLDIVGGTVTIRRRPTGVILGIMPWNYPVYQVARFVAPNLALGNTMVLKHASNCPETALAIVDALTEANVPEGVYRNLFISTSQVEQVIAHPAVQGVSLTGSERAGRVVAETAGRYLKKVVLELGGSDPLIVLDSDDVAGTAGTIVASRLSNAGQACNAPKRVIVLDDLYDELLAAVVAETERYRAGDPFDETASLAPLSSRAAAEEVVAQVRRAVEQGATLHTGGALLDDTSALMEPAVLSDVRPGTDAYREEIFGPVVVLYRAADVEEALALANDTEFGLGSSVFSSDRRRAREIGARIEAGMVYVNQAGGSQADMPFGGIKRSGIGRELGPLGIDEFANRMTIRH
ncbi:NAD-dependent succinate-semialdehyde dehydrogenase [Leucobacter sp. CSA1]|uniref:NAD-dependent succinate-semialdehyde dehydrogenase n=1 Tax=Leucobacter chromiisoli TaxID=2796471 RepID=A0A934UT76_9MICO|nr:NAD-dependent succinate-semialdehyde dehydrogenase [Leucobacter chromiisoli]MBK0418084.1 NAD-dependent succinate-semialdehyde dehydrogenase [Leucobacter chromiisoli]